MATEIVKGVMRLAPGEFAGDRVQRWTVGPLLFQDMRFAPDSHHPLHAHAKPSLCLVTAGAVCEKWAGAEQTCLAGTVIYYPAGEPHADRCDRRGARGFVVELEPDWVHILPARLRERPKMATGITGYLLRRMRGELTQPDDVTRLAVEGLVLEALAALARADSMAVRSEAQWMPRVKEYLHAHFRSTIALRDVARIAGVHPTHLARSFRRTCGSTISDYVRHLRIEWCCRQLALGTTDLIDVAASAGFADQSHFSRTFKRCVGIPPAKYRRLHKR
jgi:AraC family transcriptional regulator